MKANHPSGLTAMLFLGLLTGWMFVAEPADGRTLADQQIILEIKAELDRDKRIDLSDVEIDSDKRHVTLEGTVLTEYEKFHAGRLAAAVPDVVGVTNKIMVIDPVNRDFAIAKEIRSEILQNPALAISKLKVEVKDGNVQLQGIATDPGQKQLAQTMAQGVEGVRNVSNDILVQ